MEQKKDLDIAIAKLEVRFEHLEGKLDEAEERIESRLKTIDATLAELSRLEAEERIENRLKTIDATLAELSRLALLGRVAVGLVMTLGSGIGWLIAQWQTAKSAFTGQ